jgi:hypothetical protein
MLYVRGHPSDYDGWADLGAEGWDWASVRPYFLKCEGNARPGPLHGADGPLQVGDQHFPRPISRAFVQAMGDVQVQENPDFNGAVQEGAGLYQVTQFHSGPRKGERCSAAAAYLYPALTRPNLTVLTRTRAERITFDGQRATGVIVKHGLARRALTARHEVIVAQGTEAGGHTGEIATMVLVPQVVEACGDSVAVLAAGGIAHGSQIAAALALGAQGVWCGTVWLGTRESELDPFEKQVLFETRTEDAVRRKARTGKTVRMIRSQLSEAWEHPDAPPYLPTPLQGILYNEAHARVVRARRRELYSFPAGQVVGMMSEESSVRDVIHSMQMQYLEALERLQALSCE